MSEETGIDAGLMMAEVEQMEEGKVESPEVEGSPEKLIIDEKVQGNKKLMQLVFHQEGVFHH